jgi:FkbM family methyltransferase
MKRIVNEIELNIPEEAFKVSGCWDQNHNVWDKKLLEFAYELLNDGDCFFDIGSNTGSFSFLNKHKNLDIHCFEPNSEIFKLLEKTVNLNDFKGNHFLNNLGMSSEKTKKTLKIPYGGTGGTTISEKPLRFEKYKTQEIQLTTLDSYVSENNIKKIDFIKIDTEGHELFVIQGGYKTLKKFKPKIIMEHHPINMKQTNTTKEDIYIILNDIGYENIINITFEDLYVY